MPCVSHEGQCRLQLSTQQYGQLPDRQSPQDPGRREHKQPAAVSSSKSAATDLPLRACWAVGTNPTQVTQQTHAPTQNKRNQAAHTPTAALWQTHLQEERKRDPVHMACIAASHQ